MPVSQMNHIQLLRFAGLFQYACVGTPFLRYPTVVGDLVAHGSPEVYAWLWLGCYLLFGAVFWFLTRDLGQPPKSAVQHAVRIGLLLLLNLAAIAIGWFSQSGIAALLLASIAVVLPWLLPLRVGIVWMVVQNFSMVPVFASIRDPVYSLSDAFLQSSLYLGFIVLAFICAVVTKQQVEAREEQRRLNSELQATRTLLAESSRLGERMRISRDLHDLAGHHLTALSLNLEVASHLPGQEARAHVLKAQAVAKQLLGDVRDVVSQLREVDDIDLTAALERLVEGVPGLAIHVELPPRFSVEDPRRAQVLLRCAQEIITNALRHSGASNLWLRFERDADREMIIHARDDGRGAAAWKPGNGLAGMRERLAHYGGRIDVATARGHGFALDVRLPLEGAT